MDIAETSPLSKSTGPDLPFYTILFSFACMIIFLLVVDTLDASTGRIAALVITAVIFLAQLHVVIGLTFETLRRYSRFGISHTKKFLNHALSVLLVALPILSFWNSYCLSLGLLLMAYSRYRSPDDARQQGLPFQRRDGFYDAVGAIIWALTLFMPTIATFLSASY